MAITLYYNNKKLQLELTATQKSAKSSLAECIFLSGHVPPQALCMGIGHCRKCRVLFHSEAPELTANEYLLLSKKEQEQGIRLACKHEAQDGVFIELLTDSQNIKSWDNSSKQKQEGQIGTYYNSCSCKNEAENKKAVPALLYMDLGTTSIAWRCYHKISSAESPNDFVLSTNFLHGQSLNPQMSAGSDIMARLFMAKQKNQAHTLHVLIYNYIKELQDYLFSQGYTVEKIYLAANPAMIALAFELNYQGLLEAPYFLEEKGGRFLDIKELAPLWIAPQISPFVGADAVAGLSYILYSLKEKESFLLADMGTNGEFIVYDNGQVTSTSVPLGPALEGIGMRCGGAVHGENSGAILSFQLSPLGLKAIGPDNPTHICGVAYLQLLHILLSTGVLHRDGFFQEAESPLAKKLNKNLRIVDNEKRFYVSENLYLCSHDIENILKVKSTFYTALHCLIQSKAVHTIYLAGSLGEHIPLAILESLGFLPQGSAKYTKVIGNSSLKGMIDLSLSHTARQELTKLTQEAKSIDLTKEADFLDLFISEMHF